MKEINKIADLIMYSGPTINELLENSKNINKITINKLNENKIQVLIENILAYNVKITDKYIYDNNEALIKQSIIINDKEKIIFDKYIEINTIIKQLNKSNVA